MSPSSTPPSPDPKPPQAAAVATKTDPEPPRPEAPAQGDAKAPAPSGGPAVVSSAVTSFPPPPPLQPLFSSWWPGPEEARRWVLPAAVTAGVVAASVIPGAPRPGLNVLLCGITAAAPVGLAIRRRDRGALLLGGLAVALCAVAVLRDSQWFVMVSVLATMYLGVAAAFGTRDVPGMVLAPLLFPVAVLRALPWVTRDVSVSRARSGPWLTGLGVGGLFTVVIGSLLASADAAFARVVERVLPSLTVDLLLARVFTFSVVAAAVAGGVFAALTRPSVDVPSPAARRVRHPAEWLLPVVLVALTIGAFLAVEATMLFGGADVVVGTGETHASRAREGFGQLLVVTVLVLGLLGWAGGRAAPGPAAHRRLLGAGGGVLTALTLLLAGSALRRLWLYGEQYGATVTRVVAGSAEVWIGFMLLAVGAAWIVRRTDVIVRVTAMSAGTVLLALGVLGPDAVVARWNVDRFLSTGKIDTAYLSMLSADAVPALQRLPDPQRACALKLQDIDEDPWYAWNLSRARATEALRARPAGECRPTASGSS